MFTSPASLTFAHARPAMNAGLQAIASGERKIDLAGVTAVDSSAVSVLLAWQRAARAQGASLTFHHLPTSLGSLIALYDVAQVLGLETDRADLLHH